MKKKLACLLASGVILSQLTLPAQAFSDVNLGDWYYNDVQSMTIGGYLSGKTTTRFGAGDALSNAEFCAMLSNAFYGKTLGVLLEKNEGPWYLPYLSAVYTRGGMDNTQIGIHYNNNHQWGDYIDSGISRYDMASMITCLLEDQGVAPLTEAQIEEVLAEITGEIASQYRSCVATAYFYEFLSGYPDGGFHGDEPFIRGAAAVVLANLVRSPLIREENVSNYYTPPEDSSGSDSNVDTSGLHPYVVEVFELVNAERAAYGLYPFVLDTTLCKLAQYKSDEMYKLSYLDHTSPTYGAFSNILSNNGIIVQRARENLARGQRSPTEVVTAWMNSTEHRTNILSTDVSKVGVGFTEGDYYWSQLFTDSSANTEDGVSGDLGGTGGNGVGGNIEDDHYGMEIPFFEYNNYLEVGYNPVDHAIYIPVNNTGDFPLEFKDLYVYGANADVFTGSVSRREIPVGGSASVILIPDANLPVGQYTATVEFAVDKLTSLFQTVNIYVSEVYEVQPGVPESEYVPEPDFEVPELNPEAETPTVTPENSYTIGYYGDYDSSVENLSLVSTSQSQWYHDNYGETKVTLQLSGNLPEGTELEGATTTFSGATITEARMEEDRSKLYITFQGLDYSYQTADIKLYFREGYRAVLSPAPISVSVLINGAGIPLGEVSPYSLKQGDTIELLISDVHTNEYGFVVKDSTGNPVRGAASSYGDRSSGIYTIDGQDLYFSIGTK